MRLKKKYIYIGITAVLAVTALIIGLSTSRGLKASDLKEASDYAGAEENEFQTVTGEQAVLESEDLLFVLDTATTHFYVTDKTTGTTYQSVAETGSQTDSANQYQNEIVVDYYDSNSMLKTMYSQNNSVAFESFEVKAAEDVIRVYYDIRSSQEDFFVPSAFPKEVFEEKILDQLAMGPKRRMKVYYKLYTAGDKSMVSQHPALAQQDLYIAVDGLTNKDYLEITDYYRELGYTQEEYEKDIEGMELSELNVEQQASFLIPIEYSLAEDGFTVKVLSDQIETGGESYYLSKIRVLPAFGNLTEQRDGYFLVPDGSGAVISLEKQAGASYSQRIYDVDEAVDDQQKIQLSQVARLPVFGMDRGENGFLAMIEGAAESASVKGQVFGGTNPCSSIYTEFQMRTHDVTDIAAANSDTPYFNLYASVMTEEAPCVRYVLLRAGECDYSAMAKRYRSYLEETGVLKDRLTEEGTVLYLDYTGYDTKEASFLGIPYDKNTVLSRLDAMIDTIQKLHEEGVTSLSVRLKAYSGGGIKHGLVDSFDLSSSVGNTDQLKQLSAMLQEQGQLLYLEDSVGRIYKDSMFDSFRKLKHASRRINQMTVTRGDYDIVMSDLSKKHNSYYLISPKYYEYLVEGFVDSTKKKLGQIKDYGYAWSLFGSSLSGDYSNSAVINRVQARELAQAAIQQAEGFGGILTEGGNLYALSYADTILKLPLSDSGYSVVTEAVPFYQMVVHGYVNYAGDALNTAADAETEWLKTVECGASLYYSCMTEDYTKVKDMDYRQKLYPVSEELSKEKIVTQYQEYAELFSKLADQVIEKHEITEEGVHLTTYEDGTVIAVNYSNESVTLNQTTIAACSYAVNP